MNQLIKKILIGVPFIIFLLFIFGISYKMLPFPNNIISYGDYPYIFPSSNTDSLFTWSDASFGSSLTGVKFGSPMINYLPKLLSIFHIKDSLISYILNFLPIYILCVTTFIIIKRVSNNLFYAYFSGFFIILNNFIIEQLFYWPGEYFYNVIALVILFYLTFNLYKYGFNWNKCIYIILNSIFIIHPFFLVMYVSYLFLFFILMVRKLWKKLFIILTGILGVQSYWLIPFIINTVSQTAESAYNGNLINLFSGYISSISYIKLINFANYPGSISFKLHQGITQYFFYFTIFGIVITIVLKNGRKINKNYYILFLSIIFLFYFTVSLGPISHTTGNFWLWAFNHVPGFGFFRSFTRFLIVSIISIIFIMGIYIRDLKLKYKNFFIILGIVALFLTNIIFFTGNLNGAIGTIKVPREYAELNNDYLLNNSQQFSIISYPTNPYEAYNWSINSNTNFPEIIYFNNNFFSKPVAYNGFATFLDKRNDLFSRIFPFDNNPFKLNSFSDDLNKLNFKYIIIHKDLFNTLVPGQEINSLGYYNYFLKNPQYVIKEDNPYYSLFENLNVNPIIDGKNILFKKISPTEYKIYLKNINVNENLNFLSSFDKNWSLFLDKNPQENWCEVITNYNNNVSECKYEQKFFEINELRYFLPKSIYNNTHSILDDYANTWLIDSSFIKHNYNKSYYTENADGSINIELTIFFKPQNYFFIGSILSIITVLICLCCLIFRIKNDENK